MTVYIMVQTVEHYYYSLESRINHKIKVYLTLSNRSYSSAGLKRDTKISFAIFIVHINS